MFPLESLYGVGERLSGYARLGVPVLLTSARTGEGIGALRELLEGGISVMTGQSGVGKSSLLNALQPGLGLKEGELCAKFDRGSHTTVLSVLLKFDACPGMVVDTPGFRRFALRGMGVERLTELMPDIAAHSGACAFGPSCSHIDEQGCALDAAAESGELDPDRLDSYFRMREELLLSNELSLRTERDQRPKGKRRPRARIAYRGNDEDHDDE
jgi:ribosome biogenesis GTPase / thiamine phosphate phosphatase